MRTEVFPGLVEPPTWSLSLLGHPHAMEQHVPVEEGWRYDGRDCSLLSCPADGASQLGVRTQSCRVTELHLVLNHLPLPTPPQHHANRPREQELV